MTGSALQLAGAASTSPFGKLQPYEGVWDSTVFLWDAGFAELESVPANGVMLPNLMRDRASAVSGLTASQCDVEAYNTMGNGFTTGEITSKGGIHIASTQAGAQNAQSNFALCMSQALGNWLAANCGAGENYSVMLSLWVRKTREYGGPNPTPQSWGHMAASFGQTGSYIVQLQRGEGAPPDAARENWIGIRQDHIALDVPGVMCAAAKGWRGTRSATLNGAFQRALANVGAMGSWDTVNYNKACSGIIYRAQLDVLDFSDAPGANVTAKGLAMLNSINALAARDFGEGGRFHGDEFTPAADLKP